MINRKFFNRIGFWLCIAICWSKVAYGADGMSCWQDTTKEQSNIKRYWQIKTVNTYNPLDVRGLSANSSSFWDNNFLESNRRNGFKFSAFENGPTGLFSTPPNDSSTVLVELFGGTQSQKGGYFQLFQKEEKFGYRVWGRLHTGKNFPFSDVYTSRFPISSNVKKGVVTANKIDTQVEGGVMEINEIEDLLHFEDWRVGGSISNSNNQEWHISLDAEYQQSKGLFYEPYGASFEQQVSLATLLNVEKDNLSIRAYYQNAHQGSEKQPSYLLATGYNMPNAHQHWAIGMTYELPIEKWNNSLLKLSTNHTFQQFQSQNQIFGRNESSDDYLIHDFGIGIELPISQKLNATAQVDYLYFQPVKQGGIAYNAQLFYRPTEKHRFSMELKQKATIPSAFELFADLPLQTNEFYDIWLSGNSLPQYPTDLPLINWGIPDFNDTPLIAGFSANRAYLNWNETAKEALSTYFEENPSILPSFNILETILTDEFAPNGFFNDFLLEDILTQKTSSLITANRATITYENLLAIYYEGHLNDRISVHLNPFYVLQRNVRQFNILTPTVRFLPGFGAEFGQTVQDRIQEPYEEFLVNVGFLDPIFAAQNAEEVGTIVNQIYGQVGETILATYLENNSSFLGVVKNNQTAEYDRLTIMAGYPTFDAIQYWGVLGSFDVIVSSNITINGRYRYLSENVFEDITIDKQETLANYYLNQPRNLFEFGLSYQRNAFSGNLTYVYEEAFTAQYGFFSGEVARKNLINAVLDYEINKRFSIGLTGLNLFNFNYSSFAGLPLVERQFLMRVSYTME